MTVDYVLILSAGYGTRMGDAGKAIPKPMWPVFETTLLEMQIRFVRSFSPQKIFVNVHHQADQVEEYCKKRDFKDVVILREDELLGSGGAIHNVITHLGKVSNGERLLTINSDAFYDCDWENSFNFSNSNHQLLSVVDNNESYNKLTYNSEHVFMGVEPPSCKISKVTYAGVGLINLSKLNYQPGVSGFFDTVCSASDGHTTIIFPSKDHYLDFGTLELYAQSLRKVFTTSVAKETRDPLIERLMLEVDFDKASVNMMQGSYNSDVSNCFNFTGDRSLGDHPSSIVLKDSNDRVYRLQIS
jgi:mannose-1-phosphate guanylyltransferase